MSSLDSGQAWALGLGGAAFLPALFGGGQSDANINSAISKISGLNTNIAGQGTRLSSQGADVLGPASQYLKQLTSGNRADVLSATAPERARVIDQYDTAKKSVAEFSPRGGGTAGALANLNAKEASDLSTVGAQARQGAVQTSAQLGAQLEGLGLNADTLQSNNLNTILQTYLLQAQQKQQSASGIGEGIASLIGTVIPFL